MIILLHVTAAILSVLYSTALLFRPSKSKIYASYGLIVLTLASGTYLVFSTGARLMPACITGLAYIVIVSCGLVSAHLKLAAAQE